MMKNIILFLLILSPFAIIAQQYKTVIINEDTIMVYPKYYDYDKYHGLINKNLPDGLWVAFYDDSTSIAFKGQYRNGIPEGLFQHYYKNGNIRHTCIYKDSVQNGPFTYWDEDGSMDMIGQKINGINEGIWYQWYNNGNVRNYYSYINGKKNGIDQYYYSNGKINQEGFYNQNIQVGELKYYFKDGTLKAKQFFIDSLTVKKLKLVKKYANYDTLLHYPIGVWKEWNKNQKLIRETYHKNYEIEKEIEYHLNGELKSEIHFNGFHQGFCSKNPSYYIKNGVYKEWYSSGKLKTKGSFLNNYRNGEWKFWLENGEIEKIETYQNGKLIPKKYNPNRVDGSAN